MGPETEIQRLETFNDLRKWETMFDRELLTSSSLHVDRRGWLIGVANENDNSILMLTNFQPTFPVLFTSTSPN